MATIVTGEGQVIIPQAIRNHLGIEAGTAVEFRTGPDGSVSLIKIDGEPARGGLAALRGAAGPGLSTNEVMALTRGEE